MKKFFFLPVFIFVAFSFLSCEDDSLNPLPEKVAGQFMRLEIKTRIMDVNDMANAEFSGTLSNTSGNVVKYELYVRRRDDQGALTGDYVLMQTINSFPYNLRITPQMIADTYGLNVSDLKKGEVYTFFAYSYDAFGNKAGYLNLARIIQVTAGMQQGYKFNTTLNDPFPVNAEVPYDNHQANP